VRDRPAAKPPDLERMATRCADHFSAQPGGHPFEARDETKSQRRFDTHSRACSLRRRALSTHAMLAMAAC
jgi:hypothetical protein